MEDCIRIENVTKRYENFTLDNVSFTLPKGAIMGLIGENGAGKSTTIYALLDLIKKDSGKITFFGKELSFSKELKEDIGVVFDEINFYETLTAKKVGNISRFAYKQWNQKTYEEYLKRFSLPLGKQIKTFSKGMKMKLCIAVALSHDAKVLILDEPTAGLDPVMREEILELFLEFVQDENRSILLSSHITSDLEKIADYITFIHKGKVLFSKEKDELRYRYGILRCGEETFEKIEKKDMLAYRKEEYQYSVLVADKERAKEKYNAEVIDNTTIDELMVIYVKGERVQ